jgi:hypothetical protein
VEDRKVRGFVMLGLSKFIKKRWGLEGIRDCSSSSCVNLEQVKPSGWYDMVEMNKMYAWLIDKKGIENVEASGFHIMKERGLFTNIDDYMTPRSLLEHTKKEYREMFNFGRFDTEFDLRVVKVTISDFSQNNGDCLIWGGIFKGILAVTNKKGQVKE